MTFTFAGLFEGIGGFSLGLTRAGMTCTFHSELVPERQRVLARHFPNIPQGGDIRDVRGTDLGSPDLVVGGFPCKDTSIGKGQRRGLAGESGRLYFEYTRVVEEHLRLVDESKPRWVVIENTPGILKSNGGRDHATVIEGLEQLGYMGAWRTIDGRAFGVPQRRPRVIYLGCRGDDSGPAEQVLGLTDPSEEAAPTHRVSGRPGGPAAVPDAARDSGFVIWRKSARPRASLAAGGYETWKVEDWTNTLTGFDSGLPTRQTHLIRTPDGRLRTFTLTEWERLSGFPDGWTDTMKDHERAFALGDCFQPTVAEWLGRRIMREDAQIGV